MHSNSKKLVKLPCAFVVFVEGVSGLVAVGDGDGGGASTLLVVESL